MFWSNFYACQGMSDRIQLAINAVDDEMRRLEVEMMLTPDTRLGMYKALCKLNRYYWDLKNPTAVEKFK